ncbi:MAG: NAD(P)-dependent oxidoreductase [Bacillota bacterium]
MSVRRPQYTRVPIAHRPAAERIRDFDEVVLTYRDDEAVAEAQRCLQCYKPACELACPNHNPIKSFIRLVSEGRAEEAAGMLWAHNAISSCTGRVCAWENQCEGACPLGRKGEPVAIGALERYLAEKALSAQFPEGRPSLAAAWPHGRAAIEVGDVAVVGAGPAGLSCANVLSRRGYRVTVLDAWVAPGGVMSYGIPEFVLPKKTVASEVERLRRQGIRFVQEVVVGRDVTVDGLFEMGFRAVFLGIGANEPVKMGVLGEDLPGVVSAKDFLMAVAAAQLGDRRPAGQDMDLTGKRVIVIGAGNTAMDAARTALRLGALDVSILYRRAREHSPSRPVEMALAEEEGVRFEFLVAPQRFLGENGRLVAAEVVRMRLGAPDSSGRPSPEPIEGSEYVIPIDVAILAVGYRVERDLTAATPGLEAGRGGRILVKDDRGMTSKGAVWAGGDCVTGANTVVHAVAAGRLAAEAIAAYLQGASRAEAPAASPAGAG